MKNLKDSVKLVLLVTFFWSLSSHGTGLFTRPQTFSKVMLVTDNEDALKIKLRLISKAQHKIDMIYFIWEDDYTSSLLMQHLMLKADEGVKVRVMVDYLMTQRQVPALLTLARHTSNGQHNIEVKRFRPPSRLLAKLLRWEGIDANMFLYGFMTFDKNKLLQSLSVSKISGEVKAFIAQKNHDLLETVRFVVDLLTHHAPVLAVEFNNFVKRSHYKLLLVDDKKFVMGGRNISDQYHAHQNSPLLRERAVGNYAFQDTEVAAVEGPEDDFQKRAFDRFWNFQPFLAKFGASDSVDVADTRHYYNEKDQKLPEPLGEQVIYERAWRAKQLGFDDDHLSESTLTVTGPLEGQIYENRAQNVYWNPPLPWQSKLEKHVPYVFSEVYNQRPLHREIATEYVKLINSAHYRVDIVSAYFYIDEDFLDKEYSEIYNSLTRRGSEGLKVNIFTNSSESTDLSIVNKIAYKTYSLLNRFGVHVYELAPGIPPFYDQGSLHTKVLTIDDDVMAIGSFNLDPRSQMYDTNNIIVLKDLSGVLVNTFREYRGTNLDSNPHGLRWVLPSEEDLKKKGRLPSKLYPAVDVLRNSA